MSRSVAIDLAAEYFDSGAFLADLTRRVAFPTETGAFGHHANLLAYLEQEMVPAVRRLGCSGTSANTLAPEMELSRPGFPPSPVGLSAGG